jgi:enhancing lycopene biosynthesis protein 2
MFYFPARGGQRMIATLIRDAKVRYEYVQETRVNAVTGVRENTGRQVRVEIGRLSRNTIHKMAQRRPASYGSYKRSDE